MLLKSIHTSILSIPFRTAFKHASALRDTTQTIWIIAQVQSGALGFGEGCPREYVSAESLITAQNFINKHSHEWLKDINSIDTLSDWVTHHSTEIDANPAAWTAIELALLGLPKLAGYFSYTAVLGDASPSQFEVQMKKYIQTGFRNFKIKLLGNKQRDLAKVRALTAAGIPPQAVCPDANNLWADAGTAITCQRLPQW